MEYYTTPKWNGKTLKELLWKSLLEKTLRGKIKVQSVANTVGCTECSEHSWLFLKSWERKACIFIFVCTCFNNTS